MFIIKDQFISDMAQNTLSEKALKTAIENTIKREKFSSRGIELPINWLTVKDIKVLRDNDIMPVTPVITWEDRHVKHCLGERKVQIQKLSVTQYKALYDITSNYDEKWLDLSDRNLCRR